VFYLNKLNLPNTEVHFFVANPRPTVLAVGLSISGGIYIVIGQSQKYQQCTLSTSYYQPTSYSYTFCVLSQIFCGLQGHTTTDNEDLKV